MTRTIFRHFGLISFFIIAALLFVSLNPNVRAAGNHTTTDLQGSSWSESFRTIACGDTSAECPTTAGSLWRFYIGSIPSKIRGE